MSSQKFDVVILGAGVIGCSTAYHLAKKSDGKLKIAVVDKNKIGQQASLGAAGMLAAQIECKSAGPLLNFSIASRNLFTTLALELEQLCGISIEHQKSSMAALALDSADETELKNRAQLQQQAGLKTHWLSNNQIQENFPFLNSSSALGALFAAEDGQVNSAKLTQAFAASAKKLGVHFFEEEPCDTISLVPLLNTIKTKNYDWQADHFIFTLGSWSRDFFSLPITPIKGQVLSFQIPPAWQKKYSWSSPIYIGKTFGSNPVNCYLVPKIDGTLLLGATMEDAGFNLSVNTTAEQKMKNHATEIFPELKTFPFQKTWVGFRPGNPDDRPILGKLPGCENAWIASGHFRNGILLSPITGKSMAELLLDGKSEFDLTPFSPLRFQK